MHNGTDSDIDTDTLRNGTHTIYFKVQDNDGTWSDEIAQTLIINGKPITEIVSISPNPALDVDTISLKGSGFDDGLIIRYVWRSSLNGEFFNGTESIIDTRTLNNGTHIIYFRVQDNYGVWSDELAQTLIINGKPIAKIISISPNPGFHANTISFSGTGYDDKRIGGYYWRSDIDGQISASSSFDYSSLSVGTHTIYFKVKDDRGIWSDEVSATIEIITKDSNDDDDFSSFINQTLISISGVFILIFIILILMHRKKTLSTKVLYEDANQRIDFTSSESSEDLTLNNLNSDESIEREIPEDWSVEDLSVTSEIDSLINNEPRGTVRGALIKSKETIENLETSINTLVSKKSELENSLSNQKAPAQIIESIQKFRNRLQRAKAINSMGAAKTYAFMITKQTQKLEMMEKVQQAVEKINSKMLVLSHLRDDIIESAYDLPKEADLLNSMEIINVAIGEVHNVENIIGEIVSIENELKGLAIETDLAAQESAVDIESLPADMRAEIEMEMNIQD